MIHSLGCVSFLNSKPLIDPVVSRPDCQIHFAVPSHLLALIQSREVSTALMSVVDYHAADVLLLPAGMIGSDGPTLTVRIFSKVPANQIKLIHGDTDSHTSVILAQLITRERYGIAPPLVPLNGTRPETMLLIGDKVITAAPSDAEYPYQLDLGTEWKALTGLPFVFAMWMIRKDHADPALATLLADAQQRGAHMTEQLLDRHAAQHRWPRDLARRYFTDYLRYAVTPRARAGLALFFHMAADLGLLPTRRPLTYLELE
jgi:chorismate dehydratase